MNDSTTTSKNRRPELDGIRGLAILSVGVSHYLFQRLPVGHPPLQVLRAWIAADWSSGRLPSRFWDDAGGLLRVAVSQGWSGVDLFFVLSGFLIAGILIDHRASPRYFRTFYLRRAARILPLYGLFLVVMAVASMTPAPWGLQSMSRPAMPFWTYLTFTQNIAMATLGWGSFCLGITWSLAVEEQFYLFLPTLIRGVHPARLPWYCAGLALSAPLTRLIVLATAQGTTFSPHLLTPCRLDALMLGALCALAVRQEQLRRSLVEWSWAIRLIALLCFFALAWMTIWTSPQRDVQMKAFGYSLFAVMYAGLLLLATLRPASAEGRLTRLRPLQHVGILAYGLYLLHQIVLEVTEAVSHSGSTTLGWPTLIAALATFMLAELSWRFFEKPTLSWGHRFRY